MHRRAFMSALTEIGAAGSLAGVAQGADRQKPSLCCRGASEPTFRDVGWVWEGQGIDPQVPPSIYGLGQGARYFGLSRANLRDYTKVAPVSVDRVRSQMEGIARLVDCGKLAGYSILAAVLIDGHRPQADAARDFIAAESGNR